MPSLNGIGAAGEEGMDRKRKESLGERWRQFLQEVSIHGVRYAADSSLRIWIRCIWLIVILGGISVSVYQIYERVNYFRSYPSTILTENRAVQSLPFPSVTICNFNILSKSRADKIGKFNVQQSYSLNLKLWRP